MKTSSVAHVLESPLSWNLGSEDLSVTLRQVVHSPLKWAYSQDQTRTSESLDVGVPASRGPVDPAAAGDVLGAPGLPGGGARTLSAPPVS